MKKSITWLMALLLLCSLSFISCQKQVKVAGTEEPCILVILEDEVKTGTLVILDNPVVDPSQRQGVAKEAVSDGFDASQRIQ